MEELNNEPKKYTRKQKHDPLKIGERIKDIRQSRGLTFSKFAKEIGLKSPAMLSSYEKGERVPRPSTVKAIAKFSGVTVDYLMTGAPLNNRATSTEKLIFSQNFSRMQEEIGLSLKEIAEKGKLDYSSVTTWGRGKYIPRGESLAKLAAVFQVEPGDFFLPISEPSFELPVPTETEPFQDEILAEEPDIYEYHSLEPPGYSGLGNLSLYEGILGHEIFGTLPPLGAPQDKKLETLSDQETSFFISARHQNCFQSIAVKWPLTKYSRKDYLCGMYILAYPPIYDLMADSIPHMNTPFDWVPAWNKPGLMQDELAMGISSWSFSTIQLSKLALSLWEAGTGFNLLEGIAFLDAHDFKLLQNAIQIRKYGMDREQLFQLLPE